MTTIAGGRREPSEEARAAEVARFERAFVAARYLLGARGEALLAGLPSPGRAASLLAAELQDGERAVRARLLAVEVARLLAACPGWEPS